VKEGLTRRTWRSDSWGRIVGSASPPEALLSDNGKKQPDTDDHGQGA
jgi:hypothetical protein